MKAAAPNANESLRWSVYYLLIAIAVGGLTGRLLAVNSVNRVDLEQHLVQQDLKRTEAKLKAEGLSGDALEGRLEAEKDRISETLRLQRPFLSANDRSRWLAIRALVERGTYEIDEVLDNNLWTTIDMVQHKGRDGQLHLYSSKPPLLITLLAAEYWVIHQLTGATLASHPYSVGRFMLFTVQVLPLAWMFVIVTRLVERFGKGDWDRIFVVAAACFGTFLSTFVVVLNNHIIGAVCAAVALDSFVRIWCDGSTRKRDYAACGLAAAFAAANELPALALLALVALALLATDRKPWLVAFLPAVLLVGIGSFGTNYAAHGTLSPPYMHRSTSDPGDNWYQYKYTVAGVERESYWANRQGIDQGEPSKWVYAFNCLVGHHGVFSLTPIWLLTLVGLAQWGKSESRATRQIAAGIALLSAVCLVFYLGLRPLEDRNYGGMTSGFRWMFWFAPLWLWGMIPAVERLSASRGGRILCLVLLAASALSASYPSWNPWTHPWIYQAMDGLGIL